MFNRVYYNYRTNKIKIWETVDGIRQVIEDTVPFEYYIPTRKETPYTNIYGEPVERVITNRPKNAKKLFEYGEKTCEATIHPAVKYLHQRYGTQQLEVDMDAINICTLDIEVETDAGFPYPDKVLFPINLITFHFSKQDEVHTFGNRPYDISKSKYMQDNPDLKSKFIYHYCPEEYDLLTKAFKLFRKMGVDVLTGWYLVASKRAPVCGFDVPYLINRAELLDVKPSLSPVNKYIKRRNGDYSIEGISILDYKLLYIDYAYKKLPSFSLETVLNEELNESKLDLSGSVNTEWKTNWQNFVDYNVQDVMPIVRLEAKLKFIELVVEFAYKALIPFEDVDSTIKSLGGVLLRFLHDQNIVVPDVDNSGIDSSYPGAFVMALPGYFENVLTYDITSMYPHLIMQYNISPETLVTDITGWNMDDLIKTPVEGIYYRKDIKGILPQIVEKYFNERNDMKMKMLIKMQFNDGTTEPQTIADNLGKPLDIIKVKMQEVINEGFSVEYYHTQQMIRKVYINSFYGVLGTEHFMLFNIDNARAITLSGQHCIKWLSSSINKFMKKNWQTVGKKLFNKDAALIENDMSCLIDTDSIHLQVDELLDTIGFTYDRHDADGRWALRNVLYKIDTEFFKPYWEHILDGYAKQYNAFPKIAFKREKIITQKVILAKKKYIDVTIDDEGKYFKEPKMKITGIEIKSSSTPPFCREHLTETVDAMFKTMDKEIVTEKLLGIRQEFNNQPVDNISRASGIKDYRGWTDNIEDLTKEFRFKKSIPIHVRASAIYNAIIARDNLNLIPVDDGSKMRYIYTKKMNEFSTDVVGFVGQCPDVIKNDYDIDYDTQWKKTFQNIIERISTQFGWSPFLMERIETIDFDMEED